MDIKREGENEQANPAGGEMTPRSDSGTPQTSLKGTDDTAGTRKYSGLSTLEEDDFINTNVILQSRVEEEARGYFHWDIDNWTQLPDRVISKTFSVGGYDWDILLFPRGNQAAEKVSLYLEAKPREVVDGWHVCATFGLAMSNTEDPSTFKHSLTHHRFTAEEADWGFTQFAELRDVMAAPDSESRPLLERGQVRISAFLRVVKDPLGVLWHNFHNYSSRKHTGYVGLRNQGATCYMNSLLQSLYFTTEFRNAVYQIPTENDDPKKSVALALQRVFYNLQGSDDPVDTTELTKSFGWDSLESFMQHDVQEFNRVLQDNLETKMKGTVVDGAVARLFEGKMKSYIRCVDVEYESSRVENYYDISLNVKGCATLRDSFANYCEVETLDGENKYQAEGFGLQAARKGVIFESFPPVLQLQLKRFEYDFQRDAMVKINDRHEFPPTIDLGDFLSEDADRSQPWTYVLHGVLVHSGDLHSGHYFGLLRPTIEDVWYRFDDDRVVPVTPGEVFEEYYGGDLAVPGARGRPAVKRFTNAYMLVYIREALRDDVLGGEAPVPAHLLRRVQEDRAEEERRQREREELATTVPVKVVSDAQFSRHQAFDLSYFDQRQPADNALFVERMPRDMPLRAFIAHYAARTGQAPDSFRLWIMVGRVNKTVRCEAPLVGATMDLTLAQVLENRMPRWTELRLYCEPRTATSPADFLENKPSSRLSMVHAKFFDTALYQMRGVGSLYVQADQHVRDIIPELRALARLSPQTPITLYEEVKPALVEEMNTALTFQSAEIQSGDIICFQITDADALRVPAFFDEVQHRISVRFVPRTPRADEEYGSTGSTPEPAPLVLTASSKTPYDQVAQWLAERVDMHDPLKLRFYTVSPTGQPRQAVRRTPTAALADMLPNAMFIQPALNSEGLQEFTVMYERLEVDIVQIESMRSIRVTYVGRTMRDETVLDVLVPKAGSVKALMEATYAKVDQLLRAQRGADVQPLSLRYYEVGCHRITNILTGDELMSSICTTGLTEIVAELCTSDMLPTSAIDTDSSRHVEVFHFYRGLTHAHSLPFMFAILPNEVWSDTWERLQRKLGMSEMELKNLGVVCGPQGVLHLRQCRVIQGSVSDRTESPVVDQTRASNTPPMDADTEANASVMSDNSMNGVESDTLCLWDLLQQMKNDVTDVIPEVGIADILALHHVDRSSRHRNLHHERAIRILN
ncbi:ubiquitin-specific protease ubp15 [Coemansia sp. RSA 454]|nr:ubiquitin-specific protease ubp15 [Coemansia sp. RSA 454]